MPRNTQPVLGRINYALGPNEKLLGDYNLAHYNGNTTRLFLTDKRLVHQRQDEYGSTVVDSHSTDRIVDTDWKYTFKPPTEAAKKKRNRILPFLGFLLILGLGAACFFGLVYILSQINGSGYRHHNARELSDAAVFALSGAAASVFGILAVVCLIFVHVSLLL